MARATLRAMSRHSYLDCPEWKHTVERLFRQSMVAAFRDKHPGENIQEWGFHLMHEKECAARKEKPCDCRAEINFVKVADLIEAEAA